MQRRLKTLLPMLLLLSLQSYAGSLRYSAAPIEAWVVDAETGQPLEGVIVTADWELRGGGLALGGSSYAGELMVMESITDKDGRFYFPAWGPIRQNKGELHHHDPRLILFKSGYRYKTLSNKIRLDANAALEPVRRSDWNGKTIEMSMFKDGLDKYERSLSSMMISLRFIEEDCQWKLTPNMILELQKQMEVFRAAGVITALYSIDYLPTNEAKCGSPKDYFRGFRK